MPKFTFEKIKALSGNKYKVMQLSIDGVKQLDEFEQRMEEELKPQYRSLIAYIDHYTQTGDLPEAKIKNITGKKSKRKEFEFRTKNGIRLYTVQADNGKLIVLCGYKKNQGKDIVKFREMIKVIFPN